MLKIWMMLKEHGVAKCGRMIDQGIVQAEYLSGFIANQPLLWHMAPKVIGIVRRRFNPGGMDEGLLRELTVEIRLRLQESGGAGVWHTPVKGYHCLHVAICSHRNRRTDLTGW